jgi:prepilin-type N-terminal cleavage/methylation domain-containing protein
VRRLRNGEAGFTLIELIVVIVILGVITVPLSSFVVSAFENTTQNQQRLSVSHDIQITSAYFSQDVANTGLRTGTAYTPAQSIWVNSAPPPCATGLANAVVLFEWDDWADTNGIGTRTTDSAAYVVENGDLHRVACSDTTLSSDVTVAHNYVSGSASLACSPTACTNSTPPTTVALTIQIKAAANDTSGTTTTLTGQRRQSAS